MRHCRTDYDAIQPWPTKRSHHCRDAETGKRFLNAVTEEGTAPLIPDDEPVFILRSMDRTAPLFVRLWAALNRLDGADPVTCERVYRWADEMAAYAAEHGGAKVPDTPADLLRP